MDKLAQNAGDRLILARILDQLSLCQRKNVPTHTPFLSMGEALLCAQAIAASGHPAHLFYGGYEGAERQICAFLPDWMEAEDWLSAEDLPIRALSITYSGSGLSHRDFLGSILGLGLDREKIGDLLVEEGRCQVLCLAQVAPILISQLDQVGRSHVQAAPLPLDKLAVPERTVKVVKDTVATLRLDAVAATGFSTSRSKMAAAISSKKVLLNGRETDKPDRPVVEGDVLVCRGLGKCVLKEVTGPSKKGRVMVVLERYV